MLRHLTIAFCVALAAFRSVPASSAEPPVVTFEKQDKSLAIRIADKPFATYVFDDDQVLRPYFAHVRSPSGVQVTRNHPPVKGVDRDDHPTMHPGLWMAFGDLGGADFWRNRARVRHVEFIDEPTAGAGSGRFSVRNSYEAEGAAICTEECRITFAAQPNGTLLIWDSTFRPAQREFSFGDQEEMGLGVRVATPLSVLSGGEIRDSEGRINEPGVWGKQADWCQYSGDLDGRRVGVTLLPDPDNFRRSWFHARNYGVLVANPFGQRAFTKGETSKVVVKKGESLRLRFGVFVWDAEPGQSPNGDGVYRGFLEQIGNR